MSSNDLHTVLRPKTLGTWNLFKHLPADLDFFVLLSSLAGMTGSRGQSNYAAANTYQDAVARHLSSRRRHCISLNLGSIMSVGFAAERNLTAALRRDGFEGVSKAEFLALLDYYYDPACPAARDPRRAQLVSGLASAESLPAEHFRSVYWTSKPMFRPLLQVSAMHDRESGMTSAAETAAVEANLAALLAMAPDHAAAGEVALRALVDRLARLLAVPSDDVDPRRPIHALGIDSLIALELRYWMARELKVETSIFDIMNAKSLEELAGTVAARSKGDMAKA
jgi:KR domain/Phosphopantetheine attachment site